MAQYLAPVILMNRGNLVQHLFQIIYVIGRVAQRMPPTDYLDRFSKRLGPSLNRYFVMGYARNEVFAATWHLHERSPESAKRVPREPRVPIKNFFLRWDRLAIIEVRPRHRWL